MAPRLKILDSVIERLRSTTTIATGRLYGIVHNDSLLVLTFNLNIQSDDKDVVNHTVLQLNMPVEIDLCGVLYIDECEEKIPNAFEDIDVTDNPLLLKYLLNKSEMQAYFYIHQKLEIVNGIEIIKEADLYQEFFYIRLQGKLPFITQCGNILETLQDIRKSTAAGKVGILFPGLDCYLFNYENNSKELNLKELLNENITNEKITKRRIENIIQAEMCLKLSKDKSVEEGAKYAPVLQQVKKPFNSFECTLHIDTLSLVNYNINTAALYAILVESVCRNLRLIETCFQEQLNNKVHHFQLPKLYHFRPLGCGHLMTLVYRNGAADNETLDYRQSMHKILGLDMTRPIFRIANSLRFDDKTSNHDILISPHESITKSTGSKSYVVCGLYAYHHYMQDNFNDNGWGCAYRSLQTIISWFRLQGYTNKEVPSHCKIQECLVNMGDKPSSFIGTKGWIGSMEVGFVLEYLLGVTSKVLCASDGKDISSLAPSLVHHFKNQGTPVMIGGGDLAHTILGVAYDENSEDAEFLILDPHYAGPENLSIVLSKGWCGWKKSDFWKSNTFYNLCLPQRPICI